MNKYIVELEKLDGVRYYENTIEGPLIRLDGIFLEKELKKILTLMKKAKTDGRIKNARNT